jgi:hypothetical protein
MGQPHPWEDHLQEPWLCHYDAYEKYVYYKQTKIDGLILILWHLDDFIIGAKAMTTCKAIRKEIQWYMANPLNNLGIIKLFMTSDIIQTQHYVKVHCEMYIKRIVAHHGWTNKKATNLPLHMKSNTTSGNPTACWQLAENSLLTACWQLADSLLTACWQLAAGPDKSLNESDSPPTEDEVLLANCLTSNTGGENSWCNYCYQHKIGQFRATNCGSFYAVTRILPCRHSKLHHTLHDSNI